MGIRWLLKIATGVVVFFILPAVLIWVGWSHVTQLFFGDLTLHGSSIEISYIQMAKFLDASKPYFAWQPRWYFGYPLWLLYTPLVPVFEYVTHNFVGWSFGHAYRVLTAISYVGGLVSLYFLGRTLFKNTVAGFVSALVYGIVPSIIAWINEDVALDRFLEHIIEPRRFTILVRWGEGPHIVSLLFLPLAALFWLQFLRLGKVRHLVAGAIFVALVALTNSVGLWGLGMLLIAVSFGEFIENKQSWSRLLRRLTIIGFASYGLIAFWFHPLFITSFFREGSGSFGFWKSLFPWGWLVFGVVGAGFVFIARTFFRRFPGLTGAILFFGIMFGLVETYYASGMEKLELVPQVLRLNTEVDMGLSLLVGLGVALVGHLIHKKRQVVYPLVMGSIAVGVFVTLLPRQLDLLKQLPSYTRSFSNEKEQVKNLPEYQIAMKLAERVNDNERVFVPGNYAFYLNYFTNIPQVRGALTQSALHPWAEHMYYQITHGDDPEIALDWLKIGNVSWLVYSDAREIYRDFQKNKQRFDKVLELDTEDGGDFIYHVPLTNTSLAKAVPETIVSVPRPKNAIDAPALAAYTRYLETSTNKLTLTEMRNGSYAIRGSLSDEELLLVQMTYASGWEAFSNGQKLPMRADPLGFMLIYPGRGGNQNITLTYKKPWIIQAGWGVTLLTGFLLAVLLLWKKAGQKAKKWWSPVLLTKDKEE